LADEHRQLMPRSLPQYFLTPAEEDDTELNGTQLSSEMNKNKHNVDENRTYHLFVDNI
jgi:hypothetical protein